MTCLNKSKDTESENINFWYSKKLFLSASIYTDSKFALSVYFAFAKILVIN
ncbi:hypothetical protein OKW21_002171 [Catalinimonas alkaloidigena]|nr:hypothetical protein [Catalinimonas alkaloidigena]